MKRRKILYDRGRTGPDLNKKKVSSVMLDFAEKTTSNLERMEFKNGRHANNFGDNRFIPSIVEEVYHD